LVAGDLEVTEPAGELWRRAGVVAVARIRWMRSKSPSPARRGVGEDGDVWDRKACLHGCSC